MHILVIGAAGMIGRKLVGCPDRQRGAGRPASREADARRHRRAGDARNSPARWRPLRPISPSRAWLPKLVAARPDLIFHLAAIVSGEAEADFEKGYRVNLDGTRTLFEAIRLEGLKRPICRKSSSPPPSSSSASRCPKPSTTRYFLTPLTSYGTQKAIGELLLADYSRRGFFDGIGIRLPTISIRPGKPNKAASGFFSSILREPLIGRRPCCRSSESVKHWFASPRAAVEIPAARRRDRHRAARAAAARSPCRGWPPPSARRSRRCAASPAKRR